MKTSRFSWNEFNWTGGVFLIGYHLLLLVSLPLYLFYFQPHMGLVGSAVLLYMLAGLGITAGYHRLYSHRTFKSRPLFEAILLAMGTLAVQGSAMEWAYYHRRHHRYVDTDEDPYETPKGFWHSHLLWMFRKRSSLDLAAVSDLERNRLVRFQHRYYGYLLAAVNLAPVLFLGWLFQDYWGAVVLALLGRMFLVHHCTWFINSLAHIWGSKPFSTEHSAVNNWILAVLTFGEGYHNFHHTFAGDYRNGVRWYQFDPGKLLIRFAAKLGLAGDLRQVGFAVIGKKLIQEDRRQMLARIKQETQIQWPGLEREIIQVSDELIGKLKDFEVMKGHLKQLKKNAKPNHGITKMTRRNIFELKKSIRKDYKYWGRLCRQVLEGCTPDRQPC